MEECKKAKPDEEYKAYNWKPSLPIMLVLFTTVSCCSIGAAYIGSLTGGAVYFISILFLIAFLIINVLDRQKIDVLPKRESLFVFCVYLFAIPYIYFVSAVKTTSIFLNSLFLLYLSLVLVWVTIVEKRKLTNACIVLIILCFLPYISGFCVAHIYEDGIYDEITNLDNQQRYYEEHIQELDYGVLTKDQILIVEIRLRKFEETNEEAKDLYSVANFKGAKIKIEEAKEESSYLSRIYEKLDPKKVLYDELSEVDKELYQINDLIMVMVNDSICVDEIERIKLEINSTVNKSDTAWYLYRSGEYEKAYGIIMEINKDISNIKDKLDRIFIFEYDYTTSTIKAKILYDKLTEINKELTQINGIRSMVNDSISVEDAEQIKLEINSTLGKSDIAWHLYRSREYEKAYKIIMEINNDVSNIRME